MGEFFVYILKSSFCLALFYLFYKLLLSRETFHRFNRIAILGMVVLSLLIPFLKITTNGETDVSQTLLSIEQLLLLANRYGGSDVPTDVIPTIRGVQLLLGIYCLGIIVFLVRNIYSVIKLRLFIQSKEHIKQENGIILVLHNDQKLSPFSWMKYIVISRHDMEESGAEILAHELSHIEEKHSLDILLTEFCLLFQWFNPAIWLLKQELQNIHEYEADESVIRKGINARKYQLLLIKKAVGTRLYSMANSFNHSKLKKRITMMLKEKSSPWARLKYLYVLPVAAIAVTAFARPEVSNELKEISKIKVSELTANVVINEAGNAAVSQTPDTIKTGKGRVVTIQKYALKDSVSKVEVLPIAVGNDKPVNFHVIKDTEAPLVLVDGKEVNLEIFSTIDANKIEHIHVLKDKNLIEPYGEKGKNGVIIVTLRKEEQVKD